MKIDESILAHFIDIEDPRQNNHNFRHELRDIIIITVLGTCCGAETWTDMTEFAECKIEWLETFLNLPNGIPSHDTFARVFSLIDPKVFEARFHDWIESLDIDLVNEIIAIDGKSVRGSAARTKGVKPLHIVSAWAANKRMLLAQTKTDEKSNEITAIPEVLDLIDIKDATVTIDAMGCQQTIAKKIIDKKGDYILNLKDNQKTLHQDIQSIFASTLSDKRPYKNMLNRQTTQKEQNHGRYEKRHFTLITAKDLDGFELRWPGLTSIGKMHIKRMNPNNTNESTEYTRYFITSIPYNDIDRFVEGVRKHWQIEIDLHWTLDVAFKEDHCQIRNKNAALNLALIRRICLNLLKHEKTVKAGIKTKKKCAGWSNQYLLKLLMLDLKEKTD